MNENIDLTKILENCPRGTTLWSDNYGEVKFLYIEKRFDEPIVVKRTDGYTSSYTKEGWFSKIFPASCLLWPSKDCRDWSKFTAPWYKKEKASSQANERAWLYLVSDVLAWKDGIGQYLDDLRVQELAKRLCNEYAQKLYNPSDTGKNEQKFDPRI